MTVVPEAEAEGGDGAEKSDEPAEKKGVRKAYGVSPQSSQQHAASPRCSPARPPARQSTCVGWVDECGGGAAGAYTMMEW